MTIEIKWKDNDPDTGDRRYLRAIKYAGKWNFSYRLTRRDVSWLGLEPTREMWEFVFDSLQRRYRRREGVDDVDVEQVERLLKEICAREEEEE